MYVKESANIQKTRVGRISPPFLCRSWCLSMLSDDANIHIRPQTAIIVSLLQNQRCLGPFGRMRLCCSAHFSGFRTPIFGLRYQLRPEHYSPSAF